MEIKKFLLFDILIFLFFNFEICKTQNIILNGKESLLPSQDGGAYLFDSQRTNTNGPENIYATTVTFGGFIDLTTSVQVNQNLSGDNTHPISADLSNGNIIVAYQANFRSSESRIFATIYSSYISVKVISEFQLNSTNGVLYGFPKYVQALMVSL
jgi:hypothetical protein